MMKLEFFIADHFEALASGKILAVGLYPDRTIVLAPPAGSPEPTPEHPYILEIGLLLTLLDVSPDTAAVELQIKGPAGDALGKPLLVGNLTGHAGRTHNLLVAIRPLTVRAAGSYTVELKAGASDLQGSFTVLFQAAGQAPPPSADRAIQGKPSRRKKAVK